MLGLGELSLERLLTYHGDEDSETASLSVTGKCYGSDRCSTERREAQSGGWSISVHKGKEREEAERSLDPGKSTS